MATAGRKDDQEKPDMDLLSPYALEKIARVMTFGKKKYGANNWRGGIAFSRLLSAVMRHINAYRKGETLDPETGLSHLSHASCGLLMLLEFEETRKELDDRFFKSETIAPENNPDNVKTILLPSILQNRASESGEDESGPFVVLDDGQKLYLGSEYEKTNT